MEKMEPSPAVRDINLIVGKEFLSLQLQIEAAQTVDEITAITADLDQMAEAGANIQLLAKFWLWISQKKLDSWRKMSEQSAHSPIQ